MEATTLLWIFLGVWGGLLLLYVLYKVCGGRIADCFSCECLSGPCCDCWGNGGQIDAYDREYPFARGVVAPSQPNPGAASSLPPIVVVNKLGDSSDSEESDDEQADKEGQYNRRLRRSERAGSRGGRGSEYDLEGRAGDPLLLQSRNAERPDKDAVVVV
jgi:hypothetical protein